MLENIVRRLPNPLRDLFGDDLNIPFDYVTVDEYTQNVGGIYSVQSNMYSTVQRVNPYTYI